MTPIAFLVSLAVAGAPLPPEIVAAVDAGVAAGAPSAVLESKAREGLAKGVPPGAIVAAVGQVATGWVQADALLGPTPDEIDHLALVGAAAAALRQGADADGLRTLAHGPLPTESVWALVDIVNLGLPQATAQHLVALAANGPQPAVALRELPEATKAGVSSWGVAGAGPRLEDALAKGQPPLAAMAGADGSPGRSGEAPGHTVDHPNNGNGNNGNGNGNNGNHGTKR